VARGGGPAVARVLEGVTKTVRRHEMFSPGALVLVSVSGGPDSTCLLHALHRLRRLLRIRLAVFHFDHGLRPDSGKDAAYVRRGADRLNVPYHLRRTDRKPPRGASVEQWARSQRRVPELEVSQEIGADRIATGHTLDHQAETVLMAVLQGHGLQAVAGIPPAIGPFVRPLIDTPRSDTEAFCRSLGMRPRRDPMNRDLQYLRNAIRAKALPSLERLTGRGVREALARTASLLREDARELNRQAGHAFAPAVDEREGGLFVEVTALLDLPPPVASRVVSQALFRSGITPTQDHIEAVVDLAKNRPGRRRDLPGGLLAVRERDYVRLSRPSPETPDS
jgi:tRNA(Ile)-lysidine synthase